MAESTRKRRPRVNADIRNREVQLLDQNGTALGVVKTDAAIRMATEAGLDLVEISPDAHPPVCKILARRQ